MKRFVIPTFLFVIPFLGFSQQANYKNGFGINQDFHDYNVRLLDNKITSFDSSLSQSIRISYNRYLGRSWGFSAGITNGFLLNQTEENTLIRKSYLFGGDLDLILTLNNGRFLPVHSKVAPYLSFGYNFNYLSAHKTIGITPMVISNEYGFGFNVKLGPKSKIQVGAALNQQLNGDFDTHMQYRLGFSQSIGKEKENINTPSKPLDYDNDGIADVDDNCPTLPGISAKGGCPESWAESGANKLMSDSMFAMIEALEKSISKLKTDIDVLTLNQVVEVVCDPITGEIVENKNVKTPADTEENPSGFGETKDKPTIENKPVADKNDPPKDTKTTNPNQPNTNQPDKTATPQIADKNNPVSNGSGDVSNPMVRYKSDQEVSSYYVIAISTMDKALAERSAAMIARDYQIVKILPQPNGFYRVGIYATKTKSEAVKILDYAKGHGIPSGWIAFE